MRTRAAIYTRVSRDEQADNYSPATQEEACRRYAADLGYDVVGVWFDDYSGAEINRPKMDNLIAAIIARQVDAVICYRMDRLTRGGAHHVGYFHTIFSMHGARLELAGEDLDDSEEGQVFASFRGYASRKQWLATREATTRGLRAKAKDGKPIGRSRPPFGLRYKPARFDAEGKPIKGTVNAAYEEDPATVEYLRWMFDHADQGGSIRGIADGMTRFGVRPPYGDRTGSTMWSPASIRHILTNRSYIGEGVQFAVKVVKHPDPAFKKKRVRQDVDPEGDGAILLPEGVFPVVIDRNQFERVQRRLQTNKVESQRKDRDPEVALLRRGLVRCGHCNSALSVNPSGKNGMEYRCQSIQRRRYGCPSASINTDRMDREVWTCIKAIRSDPIRAAVLVNQFRGQKDGDGRAIAMLAALDTRLGDLRADRERLVRRLATVDEDTAKLVASELRRLSDEYQKLAQERQNFVDQSETERKRQERVQRVIDLMEGAGPELDGMTFHEKRRVLIDLGVTVWLNPHDSRPRWRMVLAFDNDQRRIRAVGDPDTMAIWTDGSDANDLTFCLSDNLISPQARIGITSTGVRRESESAPLPMRKSSSRAPSLPD